MGQGHQATCPSGEPLSAKNLLRFISTSFCISDYLRSDLFNDYDHDLGDIFPSTRKMEISAYSDAEIISLSVELTSQRQVYIYGVISI